MNTVILKLQASGVIRDLKRKWWQERHGGGQCTVRVFRTLAFGEFADTITEESNDSSGPRYTGTFNYTSFYFRAKQKKKALYP